MMNFQLITALLPFVSFLVLLSGVPDVASLSLTLQATTFSNSSSLVVWSKEQPTDDGITIFDLRFVNGIEDVGLAAANIVVRPETQFGMVSINFPKAGDFVVKAVTGSPRNTVVGTSNSVSVFQLPQLNTTATTTTKSSHPTPTSSPTTSSTPSSSAGTVPRLRNVNLPAIVGGILGALILIGLLATLAIFLLRRKHAIKRRWTFHKDMMFRNQRGGAQAGSTRIPSPPPTLPVLPLPSPSGVSGMSDPEMQAVPGARPASMTRTPTSRTLFCVPWDKHPDLDRDIEQGPKSPKTPTSPQSMNIRIPAPVMQSIGSPTVSLPPGAAAPSEPFPRSLILGTGHIVPVPHGPRDSSPTKLTPVRPPVVMPTPSTETTKPTPPPLPTTPRPPPPAIIRKLPQPVIRASNVPPTSTSDTNSAAASRTASPAPAFPVVRTHQISITPLASSLTTETSSSSLGITAPARSRRQAEIRERIVQLSGQMQVLQEEDMTARALGEEESHVVVLEDMKKQMVWLRDNESGPWAMGTSDTPPPGYMRYMIP